MFGLSLHRNPNPRDAYEAGYQRGFEDGIEAMKRELQQLLKANMDEEEK